MAADPGSTESRTTRTLDDIWVDEHDHLHSIAARMLRDASAAEDVIQDAFGRLMRVDLDEIDDTRAWLTVAVRRLCLTRLGSAYHRRESTAGAAPPDGDPARATTLPTDDPAERATLDDQVQQALGIVLDRLSPAERTSFVLHDVFGFPYDQIGTIVGRTATACRQLASRARRSVRDAGPRSGAPTPAADTRDLEEHQRLVERFIAACNAGDMTGLIQILDPDADGEFVALDGRPIGHGTGPDHVARGAIRFLGPGSGSILVPVLGERGVDMVALYANGRSCVFELEVIDGVIRHLRGRITPASSGDSPR